jgi:hypothetical protein
MSLSDYLIQGNSSFVDGDYQNSMQNYSLEIEHNPKSSEAFSKRASCKLKLNDYLGMPKSKYGDINELGATQDAITSFQLDSSNHVAYFVHGYESSVLSRNLLWLITLGYQASNWKSMKVHSILLVLHIS